MKKGHWAGAVAAVAALVFGMAACGPAVAQQGRGEEKRGPEQRPKAAGEGGGECFGCHGEVGSLWKGSSHADLGCDTCHGGTQEHLRDPEKRPVTDLEPKRCGTCHEDQFKTFFQVDLVGPARQEKGVPEGRSPQQDKLLAPHGFTVEHNEPRAHPFMVVDQLIVDRFAGGRYQLSNPWWVSRPGKTWEAVKDTGTTIPGLAKAGNPTCLQCKTSDLILTWSYMGDKSPRAKWDRTSDVNALIRDVNNPMGCIHCHDPHATRPRVVRDALIEGVQRDGATPYAADPGKDALQVVSFRDAFRKIGLVRDGRSNLLCGQCHVEYACNPGIKPEGDEKITFESRLTNHFPMKNALDILAHYDRIGFRDFKHAVTGARLVKLQHPEMETYWGSAHDRAGVKCVDCHMLKEKSASGREFTSHRMVRPAHETARACLRCHPDSTEKELLYQIDAVQNYTRGKIRKAEYQLNVLIDTYAEAVRIGCPEEVLAKARRQHEIAHVLWEWWTAENSDGWHNPELARKALLASEAAAKEGVRILCQAVPMKTQPPVVK